jgi:hypothetical protein
MSKAKTTKARSTKTVIRAIYSKSPKGAFTLAQLIKKCNAALARQVKPNTVETAIIDLKNPKWSVGEILVLAKNEKKQFVVA